jgi:membrane protein implicated in regulation of membrane protease activity
MIRVFLVLAVAALALVATLHLLAWWALAGLFALIIGSAALVGMMRAASRADEFDDIEWANREWGSDL